MKKKAYLTGRRISNLIVDSRSLLRTSVPILALVSLLSLILILVNINFAQVSLDLGNSNTDHLICLAKVSSDVIFPMMFEIIVVSIVCLIAWLFISHRIFGPIVAIRRQIRLMAKGDYD